MNQPRKELLTMKKWIPSLLIVFLCLLNVPLCFSSTELQAIDATQALKDLKDGNQRFVDGALQHPNQTLERRQMTAIDGQHPFVTLLSCSDSRVPLEVIFDRGVGDLFVIRVAGNIAGSSEIGTAEYGVEHLHTPLLVVMGHSKCGAVTAAATHAEASGKIEELVEKISPVVEKLQAEHPDLKGDDLVNAAVEANVRNTIATLLDESPVLKKEVEEKKLTVVGAIYDISSGKITWLENEPKAA